MKQFISVSVLFVLLLSFSFSAKAQFQNPKKLAFTWQTDITKHNVKLSEIQIVMPKHSFPQINYPDYVGKQEATVMFFGKEPVIAVSINGASRAYPLNMLTVHEMVNDNLNGVPILATYCPLCNSGMVFNRNITINGKEEILEFEVSGMLRNSDMIMMDTKTESLWQQLSGEAIVGSYTDAQLTVIPSVIVSVDEFFMHYPQGKILSKKTGIKMAEKHYGNNPYVNYDGAKSKPIKGFFNPLNVSGRLSAMERIVDIKSKGIYKIYPFSVVAKKGVINDDFNDAKVVVFYQKGTISILDKADIKKSKDVGTVTVFNRILDGKVLQFIKNNGIFEDTETHSKWDIMGYCFEGKLKGKQLKIEPHSNHFAFAWLAFHPRSKIYKK